jgi:hypothetical protein
MIVDSKGTNDPYIEITYKDKTIFTKNKEDAINSVINLFI